MERRHQRGSEPDPQRREVRHPLRQVARAAEATVGPSPVELMTGCWPLQSSGAAAQAFGRPRRGVPLRSGRRRRGCRQSQDARAVPPDCTPPPKSSDSVSNKGVPLTFDEGAVAGLARVLHCPSPLRRRYAAGPANGFLQRTNTTRARSSRSAGSSRARDVARPDAREMEPTAVPHPRTVAPLVTSQPHVRPPRGSMRRSARARQEVGRGRER